MEHLFNNDDTFGLIRIWNLNPSHLSTSYQLNKVYNFHKNRNKPTNSEIIRNYIVIKTQASNRQDSGDDRKVCTHFIIYSFTAVGNRMDSVETFLIDCLIDGNLVSHRSHSSTSSSASSTRSFSSESLSHHRHNILFLFLFNHFSKISYCYYWIIWNTWLRI